MNTPSPSASPIVRRAARSQHGEGGRDRRLFATAVLAALLCAPALASPRPARAQNAAGGAARTAAQSAAAREKAASTKADSTEDGTTDSDDNARVTAFLKAARQPLPYSLEKLLAAGMPVNARSARGETALQIAATAGELENVAILLRHGADLNAITARGATALGWAARNGHHLVVRALLDAGADPDAADSPNHAPVVLAVAYDHLEEADMLFDGGSKATTDAGLAAALIPAVLDNGTLTAAEDVGHRVAPLLETSPRLRSAAIDSIVVANPVLSAAMLKSLEPASRAAVFQTELLPVALAEGRNDLAADAVHAGADVNARHPSLGSPLEIALRRSDSGAVGILIAAGVDTKAPGIDQQRVTEYGGDALADRLALDAVRAGGDVDARNAHGETLLFRAAQRGDLAAVRTLLDLHANPAATVERWPGDAGWTPLMIAAAEGQAAVVDALLAAGAAVDQRNGSGRTALAFAAAYARRAVATVLLTAGADPDAPDSVGLTPLELAEADGDVPTTQALRGRSKTVARGKPGPGAPR